jgi:NDP-4-keto-2,6-dideoxyhexose 3-C-methyltransferase
VATIAETKTCYVCFGSELTEILDLGVQPMSGIFPLKGEADPTCSPLILMRCKSTTPSGSQCGNVQLKHKADFAEMYGMSYGYNSSLSPFMLSHLYEIANRVKSHVKITEPDYILDIGCNDGSFLNLFKNETSNLIGVDPSSGKFIDLAPKEARIFVDFFPSSNVVSFMGEKKFKAISSIAMFYDLDNPFLFMKAIYESLTDDGIWVVELSELREFMKNLSYDQICHEHLLYLDADLMTGMAEKVGFRLIETTFSEINGGSACYYFRKSIPNPSALCESGVTLSQLETLK